MVLNGEMCRFLLGRHSLPAHLVAWRQPAKGRLMSIPVQSRLQIHHPHKPKALTVFAAAFVAGAAAAVGLNRALDVHIAQSKPHVESESIFVALHSLPQGSPVTVWDVALRDWPKAMLPTTAMRATDSFDGVVLRHPIREGQPLLSVQLVKAQSLNGRQFAQDTAIDSATIVSEPPVLAARTILKSPRPSEDLWPDSNPPKTVVVPVQSLPSVAAPSQQTQAKPPAQVPVSEPAPAPVAPVHVHVATQSPLEAPPTLPAIAVPTLAENALDVEPILKPILSMISDLPISNLPISAPPKSPPTAVTNIFSTPSTDLEPLISTPPTPTATAKNLSEKSRSSVTRYLVVPESIASAADASFVLPTPQPSPVALVQVQAQATVQVQSPVQARQPLARVPQPAAPSGQQSSPALPRTATKRPLKQQMQQQSQQTTQKKASVRPIKPPVADAKPTMFQSMFPNFSANAQAIERELATIRRERETGTAPAGLPANNSVADGQPGQKSARKPASSGSVIRP